MPALLQKIILKEFTQSFRDLANVTPVVNAVNTFVAITATPTQDDINTLLEALADTRNNLPNNKIAIYNDIERLIESIKVKCVVDLVGQDPLPSTANTETGEVTFESIIDDLQAGLGLLGSSVSALTLATTIVNKINAVNPELTISVLAADIAATAVKNDQTVYQLSQAILSNLNDAASVAVDIRDAIYDVISHSSNQDAFLADLNEVEKLMDLKILKNDLISAFTNSHDNSTVLANAIHNVFVDHGVGVTSLDVETLAEDITASIDTANSSYLSLAALSAVIANNLEALNDSTLTAGKIEAVVLSALGSSLVPNFIIQSGEVSDDLKTDIENAEKLADYTTILASLDGNLESSFSTAEQLAAVIYNAYNQHDNLSLENLIADINSTMSLMVGSSDAAKLASIAAHMDEILDAVESTAVNAQSIRAAIFNPMFYTPTKTDLFNDVVAAESYINFNDLIRALAFDSSYNVSTSNSVGVLNNLNNYVSVDTLASSIVSAIGLGSPNLTEAKLASDIAATIARDDYSGYPTTTDKLKHLGDLIHASLLIAQRSADGIEDAVYDNLDLGKADRDSLVEDVTNAEALLDIVHFKYTILRAIETSDLYNNNDGDGFDNNSDVEEAITDLAQAIHNAISLEGITQTLTADEIAKSIVAGYSVQFEIDDINYIVDTREFNDVSMPAYQVFVKTLYQTLNEVPDNTITTNAILDALFDDDNDDHLVDPVKYNMMEDIEDVAELATLAALRDAIVSNIAEQTEPSSVAEGIQDAFETFGSTTLDLTADIAKGIEELNEDSSTSVADFVTILTNNLNAIDVTSLSPDAIVGAMFGPGLILQSTTIESDLASTEAQIRALKMRNDLLTALYNVIHHVNAGPSYLSESIAEVVGLDALSTNNWYEDVEDSLDPFSNMNLVELASALMDALGNLDDVDLNGTKMANALYGTIPTEHYEELYRDVQFSASHMNVLTIRDALTANLGELSSSSNEFDLAAAILGGISLSTYVFSQLSTVTALNELWTDINNTEIAQSKTVNDLIIAINLAVDNMVLNELSSTEILAAVYDNLSSTSSHDDVAAYIISNLTDLSELNGYGPYTTEHTVKFKLNTITTATSVDDLAAQIINEVDQVNPAPILALVDLSDDIRAQTAYLPLSTYIANFKTAIRDTDDTAIGVVESLYNINNVLFPTSSTGNGALNTATIPYFIGILNDVEEKSQLVNVKESIINALTDWSPNSTANQMARAIVHAVGASNPELVVTALESDIFDTVSIILQKPQIASAIINNLNELDDNSITASEIANAVFATGAIGNHGSTDISHLTDDIGSVVDDTDFSDRRAILLAALNPSTTLSTTIDLAEALAGALYIVSDQGSTGYVDGSSVGKDILYYDILFADNYNLDAAGTQLALYEAIEDLDASTADDVINTLYSLGQLISVPTNLITNSNPADLFEDATAVETAMNVHSIVNQVATSLNSVDENTNVVTLANYLTDWSDVDYTVATSFVTSLRSDIQHSISSTFTELALSNAIKSNLNLILANPATLDINHVVNAYFGSTLIHGGSSSTDSSTLQTLLNDAVSQYNTFNVVIDNIKAAMSSTSSTALATSIIAGLHKISGSTSFSGGDLSSTDVLNDILSSYTNDPVTLYNHIRVALDEADHTALGIENAIYNKFPSVGLIQPSNLDRDNLATDIDTAIENAASQANAIKLHLINGLANINGDSEVSDLAAVIKTAIDLVSVASTYATTPLLTHPLLTLDELEGDINYTLNANEEQSVLHIAYSISRQLNLLGNSPTLDDIYDAIVAEGALIINPVDQIQFDADVDNIASTYNGVRFVIDHLKAALGNGSTYGGGNALNLATDLYNAIELISGSSSNEFPLLTVKELQNDVASGNVVEIANDLNSSHHGIYYKLNQLDSTATPLDVYNAIFSDAPSLGLDSTTNANAAAFLVDLNAAVDSTHSFAAIALALSEGLNSTHEITNGFDLADAIAIAVDTLSDASTHNSIAATLAYDELVLDVQASVSGSSYDVLAAVIKANLDSLLLEPSTITAALIADAVFNSSGLVSSNPNSLLADLVTYQAETNDYPAVSNNIGNLLDSLDGQSTTTGSSIANGIIEVLVRVGAHELTFEEFITDVTSASANPSTYAGILADLVQDVTPTDATDIVDSLYGDASNNKLVPVDSVSLYEDLVDSQEGMSPDTIAAMAAQIVSIITHSSFTNDLSGATELAAIIINNITINGAITPNLTINELAADILASASGTTVTDLANAIVTALSGTVDTAELLQAAIYGAGRVLAIGSDAAKLLADINAAQELMTSGGSSFEEIGELIYSLTSTYVAGSSSAGVESLVLAEAILSVIDTISSSQVFDGSFTADVFANDILAALSHGDTTQAQVAYVVSHITTAFTNFTGTTATDVYNALYSQLTRANPAFLLDDIISSEGVDNRVTVTSLLGNNTIAAAANSGNLDGTMTGLLGNELTCEPGHTHVFYAYTQSTEATPDVFTFSCSVQSAIAFMMKCATWSMQVANDADLYGSYDGGSTFVYDGAVLADKAFQVCVAGMNHQEPV